MKEVAESTSSYPLRGGSCVYFGKAASGGRPASSNASTPRAGPCGRLRRRFATCPPKQSFFGASRALAARDSRHYPKRAAVRAAHRSLITSPGRPPALRPAPYATIRRKSARRAGRSGRARATNATEKEDVMAKHMTLDTRKGIAHGLECRLTFAQMAKMFGNAAGFMFAILYHFSVLKSIDICKQLLLNFPFISSGHLFPGRKHFSLKAIDLLPRQC